MKRSHIPGDEEEGGGRKVLLLCYSENSKLQIWVKLMIYMLRVQVLLDDGLLRGTEFYKEADEPSTVQGESHQSDSLQRSPSVMKWRISSLKFCVAVSIVPHLIRSSVIAKLRISVKSALQSSRVPHLWNIECEVQICLNKNFESLFQI